MFQIYLFFSLCYFQLFFQVKWRFKVDWRLEVKRIAPNVEQVSLHIASASLSNVHWNVFLGVSCWFSNTSGCVCFWKRRTNGFIFHLLGYLLRFIQRECKNCRNNCAYADNMRAMLDQECFTFWWRKKSSYDSLNALSCRALIRFLETFSAISQRHLTAEYLYLTEIFALGMFWFRHLYVKLIDL